jgi:TonB family protein
MLKNARRGAMIRTTSLLRLAVVILAAVHSTAAQEFFPTRLESFAYPLLAGQARIHGEVELLVTVGADGAVADANATNGHKLLAKAAIEAIRRWRFAERCPDGGKATGGQFVLKVRFSFEGETRGRPRTKLRYIYPDLVEVIGELPLPDHAEKGGGREGQPLAVTVREGSRSLSDTP